MMSTLDWVLFVAIPLLAVALAVVWLLLVVGCGLCPWWERTMDEFEEDVHEHRDGG